MSSYRDNAYYSKTHDNLVSDSSIHHGNRKVFFNPNFRQVNSGGPQRSSLYVNPNFNQSPIISSSTIYVNPNFVKANNTLQNKYTQQNIHINTVNTSLINQNRNYIPVRPFTEVNSISTKPLTIKSRYSIVRNKIESVPENPPKSIVASNTHTYKINKYKSVSIKSLKKKLEVTTPLLDKNTYKVCNNADKNVVRQPNENHKAIETNSLKTRYRIVKHTSKVKLVNSSKSPTSKRLSRYLSSRNMLKMNSKLIKVTAKNFKKNNIPCPLFRKYGKCIRHVQGNCAFLHDKKHVNLCRKFLCGSCHDKDCPLSHELTVQKMPTCSFYLKGMCTKEDCPYLHVKLSEKTKICTDFLKGYCEKGENCQSRHINACPDYVSRGVCIKKHCPFPHKQNKRKVSTTTKMNVSNLSQNSNPRKKRNIKKEIQNPTPNIADRYYTEDASTSNLCEVIRPSRCKLGTLPSFIQL